MPARAAAASVVTSREVLPDVDGVAPTRRAVTDAEVRHVCLESTRDLHGSRIDGTVSDRGAVRPTRFLGRAVLGVVAAGHSIVELVRHGVPPASAENPNKPQLVSSTRRTRSKAEQAEATSGRTKRWPRDGAREGCLPAPAAFAVLLVVLAHFLANLLPVAAGWRRPPTVPIPVPISVPVPVSVSVAVAVAVAVAVSVAVAVPTVAAPAPVSVAAMPRLHTHNAQTYL